MPTPWLANFHWASPGTSLRWGLWHQHTLEQPRAQLSGNGSPLQGGSALDCLPTWAPSLFLTQRTKTRSYHPGPATRLSHSRGDISPLYFTSLEHWFESSSSMSSQKHTPAGHGDDSLSSAEAELCISKESPGLRWRGGLHPAGYRSHLAGLIFWNNNLIKTNCFSRRGRGRQSPRHYVAEDRWKSIRERDRNGTVHKGSEVPLRQHRRARTGCSELTQTNPWGTTLTVRLTWCWSSAHLKAELGLC